MGEDATDFLNNIIDYERNVFCNMFFSENRLPIGRGRSGIQNLVFKINSIPAIFGKKFKAIDRFPNLAWDVLPNMESSMEGVGYFIYKLRERKVSDKEIYKRILSSRDEYSSLYELRDGDVSFRKMSVQLYNATKKGLELYFKEN